MRKILHYIGSLPPPMFILYPSSAKVLCLTTWPVPPTLKCLLSMPHSSKPWLTTWAHQARPLYRLPSCCSSRAVHTFMWTGPGEGQLMHILWALRWSWGAGGGARESLAACGSILYPPTHTLPVSRSLILLLPIFLLKSHVKTEFLLPRPLSSWKLYCSEGNLSQSIFHSLNSISLHFQEFRALKFFSSSV